MSTSSSLRQQFGAFCTNVPLGVRTLLEAPGLTTTLTAPKTALCVCVSTPGQKVFFHWFNGRGCLEKAPKPATCVCPPLDKGSSFHHSFHLNAQGGSDPFSSHCLTKTLLIGCDIRRGLISELYLPSFPHAVTLLFHFLIHGPSCFHPQTSVLQLI